MEEGSNLTIAALGDKQIKTNELLCCCVVLFKNVFYSPSSGDAAF